MSAALAPTNKPLLIGVAERVDLPDWGVTRLRAKIDTGARTSALHVNHIEELDNGNVRFTIVLHRNKQDERVTVEAPVVRRSRVRSSSGRSQERVIVSTRLVIGGIEKNIEISLASRRRMIFRMLLGRSALAGDFIIDPSRRYLSRKAAKKRKKRGVRSRVVEAVVRATSQAAELAKKTAGQKTPKKKKKKTPKKKPRRKR